jgi:hypothetical protein
MLLFTPHPPLRGTLTLQERDSLQTFFHSGQFWSQTTPDWYRILPELYAIFRQK